MKIPPLPLAGEVGSRSESGEGAGRGPDERRVEESGVARHKALTACRGRVMAYQAIAGAARVQRAKKQAESGVYYPDGYFLRIRIWEVPAPVPRSEHRFKYSCFNGRPGQCAILYDNERGKGDHRPYGEHEEECKFRDIETLVSDFLADVRKARGENNE